MSPDTEKKVESIIVEGNVQDVTITYPPSTDPVTTGTTAGGKVTIPIPPDNNKVTTVRITLDSAIPNGDGSQPDTFEITVEVLGCFHPGKEEI